MLRGGGCYLEVGSIAPGNVFSYDATALVRGNVRLVATSNYSPWALEQSLAFLSRNLGRFPFERVVSHVFPLERISEAFAQADWAAAPAAPRRRLPRRHLDVRMPIARSCSWRSGARRCRATGAGGRPGPAGPAPSGQMTWAVHFTLAPRWLDPAESEGIDHAVSHPLRRPRRAPQADAVGPDRALPGRVVVAVARRARVRLRAPERRQVPQRRAADGRRREVLLRALPRRQCPAPQGQGEGGAGRRPAAHPVPPQGAVAGLHHVLRHDGDQRRAGSCRASTSRAWARTDSRRRRSAPAPTGWSASRRASR